MVNFANIHFQNPAEYCFNAKDKNCSRLDLYCDSVSFIVVYVKNIYALNIFFVDFHFCENFVE
jgi:hypothetical protein